MKWELEEMLDNFYQKYFNVIINIIGCWCIFQSISNSFEISYIAIYSLPEVSYQLILSMIYWVSLIGGVLFLKKNRIGWIILIGTITFLITNKISLISFYYEILNEPKTGGLLDLINKHSFDPWEEIKKTLLRIAGLFLLLAILVNQVFLKKIKIKSQTVFLSIFSGVLVFCLIEIIFSFL